MRRWGIEGFVTLASLSASAALHTGFLARPQSRSCAVYFIQAGQAEEFMAPKGSQRTVNKIVAENRKARYNYEIMDTFEAGLMLTGTEVKALREGKANIAESYASDEGNEIWLINSHLPEYLQANRFNHEPRRRRKLLLSKREISRLRVAINREGMTLVPLKIYFNEKGRAKLELALAKGKKLHDKRETEKERDWNRQKSRLMKAN
jgi:SsrA-binding protein